MNSAESTVRQQFEERGYKALRGGAPDFVFYKEENNKIIDAQFVEVKSYNNDLSKRQKIYKKILKRFGIETQVVAIPRHKKQCVCGRVVGATHIAQLEDAMKKHLLSKYHLRNYDATPPYAYKCACGKRMGALSSTQLNFIVEAHLTSKMHEKLIQGEGAQ